MSLYHEASQVVEAARINGGSIKSHVFSKKTWKSDTKSLFALSTEASKWSEILSEVIERSGVLKAEKQLTPILALVLVHDLLLSKKGLALPKAHGLSTSISRHKARLNAELTKARLRRGFPSLEALRSHINDRSADGDAGEKGVASGPKHPRWIRVNTLKTSMDEQLKSTFAEYATTTKLEEVMTNGRKLLHADENVANLVAISPSTDVTRESAYKEGKLILQDKASCFPALLLDPGSIDGDIIDACAAPGNKTTHLAALVTPTGSNCGSQRAHRTIFACERDALRSQTLAKMVKLAGGEDTTRIKAKQDFLRLEPQSKEFANVTCLLIDPSCSGSGIVGRDEVTLDIHVPDASKDEAQARKGKKRKREAVRDQHKTSIAELEATAAEEVPTQLDENDPKLEARLSALSDFQLRLLQHAMAFPAARRITYSTCSVHSQENEDVVVKAMLSGRERGWRILRRAEQGEGLRKWRARGKQSAVAGIINGLDIKSADLDAEEISNACIRCEKKTSDGTMGFFVAGFVRDSANPEASFNGSANEPLVDRGSRESPNVNDVEEDNDEWNGFSD